jgi:hypothetical protein
MPNCPGRSFETEREAKEFLIARIMAAANRDGIELSEVERKMLYFSETGWTLPGMLDLNAEFEREYNNEEYEAKIAGIIRRIERTNAASGEDDQLLWDDAIVKLSEGDHYLLILIGLGTTPARETAKWLPSMDFNATGNIRPSGDRFRLIIVALASIVAMAGIAAVVSWLGR